jgi:hypothetical protein
MGVELGRIGGPIVELSSGSWVGLKITTVVNALKIKIKKKIVH